MPTPSEPEKSKVKGATLVERKNNSNPRNQGPDGDTSPLQKSMDAVPVVTKDQRKTGKVG
jgi:hypothetical protein